MDIKNFIMGVAIFILTIAVAVYGIQTFYEKPVYEDFCINSISPHLINSSLDCETSSGKWISYVALETKGPEGYCDLEYYCRQDYDHFSEKYSRNIFLISLPLGVLIIIAGAVFFGLEAVGAGLMAGGVGIIFYGIGGFWRFADTWLRFVLSLIGLVVLIYFAYWFNNRYTKKKKK